MYKEAWEEEYRKKGRIWSGQTDSLPKLSPGSHVLELGCGNGKTLSAMLKTDWQVTAIDISPSAVGLCQELVMDVNDRFTVFVGDAEELTLPDNFFDAVFAYHVIGHAVLEGRTKMASEIRRVLKKDGKLFIRVFTIRDMRAGTGEKLEKDTYFRGNGIITHYFEEEELSGLFSGFKIVQIERMEWDQRTTSGKQLRSEISAVLVKK